MTPGSLLMASGAFILVAVTAYDFYRDSMILDGFRRRKHQAYVDSSPGSTFSKRLAQHGLAVDSETGKKAGVARDEAPDLLDDLEAFHAWLISGNAGASRAAAAPSTSDARPASQ